MTHKGGTAYIPYHPCRSSSSSIGLLRGANQVPASRQGVCNSQGVGNSVETQWLVPGQSRAHRSGSAALALSSLPPDAENPGNPALRNPCQIGAAGGGSPPPPPPSPTSTDPCLLTNSDHLRPRMMRVGYQSFSTFCWASPSRVSVPEVHTSVKETYF